MWGKNLTMRGKNMTDAHPKALTTELRQTQHAAVDLSRD
jgi:hypothetical protein